MAQAILDFDDKKYDAALENLRHALQIEPNHVEALYYTGVVYMTQRHVAEAIPFVERARARAPSDPAVAFQLALAYVGQQEYNRAKPLLEEVFRVDPTMDGVGDYLGFIRYRDKDYRGALAAFRAGRSSDPEIQQLTRFYSALALGVLGLPSQATAEVDQALRLAPGTRLTGPRSAYATHWQRPVRRTDDSAPTCASASPGTTTSSCAPTRIHRSRWWPRYDGTPTSRPPSSSVSGSTTPGTARRSGSPRWACPSSGRT